MRVGQFGNGCNIKALLKDFRASVERELCEGNSICLKAEETGAYKEFQFWLSKRQMDEEFQIALDNTRLARSLAMVKVAESWRNSMNDDESLWAA